MRIHSQVVKYSRLGFVDKPVKVFDDLGVRFNIQLPCIKKEVTGFSIRYNVDKKLCRPLLEIKKKRTSETKGSPGTPNKTKYI